MTDVDGTLSLDGERFDPTVADAVRHLRESGITVGLVSGRTVPRLESVAESVGADGPLIAENGAVAKLRPKGELIGLGYSRQPAMAAMVKLKEAFPGAIYELYDNIDRLVDVTIRADGLACHELQKAVPGIQLLDSGYMIHLMPPGISKGGTLMRLLPRIDEALQFGQTSLRVSSSPARGGHAPLSPDDVVVFGDSPTDLSLFQSFPGSVRILNPRLPPEHLGVMEGAAAYESESVAEKGFVEVAEHIIKARAGRRGSRAQQSDDDRQETGNGVPE
jgi:hydroxymethylpyrimidine pyrophosphatase-like HAD family hydrolase